MKEYKNGKENLLFVLSIILLFVGTNSFWIVKRTPLIIPLFVMCFIAGICLPLYSKRLLPNFRFKVCEYGTKMLKIFVWTTVFALIVHTVLAVIYIPDDWKMLLISMLIAYISEVIMFWIGIICVYCSSTQLGIKIRLWGAILGMTPIANLIMLFRIIKITDREVEFEWSKMVLNEARKDRQVCATKYPILMVHGVFFRDSAKFDYWGRVPNELKKNGATIFYGEHESASSIEDSAIQISERIKYIIEQTGCEKLNIIAHSKGGLDCRLAIYKYGLEPYIASLTTINTPHRGCKFADYLLGKMPIKLKETVANAYNTTLKQIGDNNPDFIAAVSDLSSDRCKTFNEMVPMPVGVYCQSTGSNLRHAVGGKFPLNFSFHLVKHFDGPNDGLVGKDSFEWGEKFMYLTNDGIRGISHGDMIDLNRQDIPGFDVREFYVELVCDLKNRGV